MIRRLFWGSLLVGLFILSSVISINGSAESEPADFQEHDPIFIEGEEDLTPVNGISGGNGTISNPFLITELFINTTGPGGIEIRNVSSHLHLYQNVVINSNDRHDPFNITIPGILLINCSNVSIERNYVYYFNTGLEVIGSDNITVHDSSFSQNHDAILMEADDSSITGCFCSYNTRFGVFINNSRNLFLKDILADSNSFTMGEGAGIQTVNCSEIIIADCYGTLNYGGGISIIGSYDGNSRGGYVVIKDCYMDSCVEGVQIVKMDHVVVESTRLRGNTYGVHIVDSLDVVVHGNMFYKNSYGLHAYLPEGSTISNNEFDRNEIAVHLDSPSAIRITDNRFINSTTRSIQVKETASTDDLLRSQILRNRFIYSGSNEEQIFDPTDLIDWSEGGKGNYWDDWQVVDENKDVIVDQERELGGGAVDEYPIYEGDTKLEKLPEDMDQKILDGADKADPTEYWLIVGLSIAATFGLAIFVVIGSRDRSKE
jgi:parallel beta-helix repeat protein